MPLGKIPGRSVLPLRVRRRHISRCSANCCAATASRSAFYGDHSGIFVVGNGRLLVPLEEPARRNAATPGPTLASPPRLSDTTSAIPLYPPAPPQSPQAKGPHRAPLGRPPSIASPASSVWLRLPSGFANARCSVSLLALTTSRRFARRPSPMQTAWRPAPQNGWDRICCFLHQLARGRATDNIVQWRVSMSPESSLRPTLSGFAGAKAPSLSSSQTAAISALLRRHPAGQHTLLRQGDIFMLPLK